MLRSRMLLSASLVCAAAIAEEPPTAPHPCANIAHPTERLACFDDAFPLTPEAAAAQTQIAREEFGRSEAQLRKDRPERSPREEPLRNIEASVANLDYTRTGERVITLDNGQIWRELEVTLRGPLAEGDRVEVRRGVGGSYRLFTPGRVGLRVRRVK